MTLIELMSTEYLGYKDCRKDFKRILPEAL